MEWGFRCVGKYVYDNGIVDKTTLTVDTLAGIKTLELQVDKMSKQVVAVTVNMGEPIFKPDQIPALFEEESSKKLCRVWIWLREVL